MPVWASAFASRILFAVRRRSGLFAPNAAFGHGRDNVIWMRRSDIRCRI